MVKESLAAFSIVNKSDSGEMPSDVWKSLSKPGENTWHDAKQINIVYSVRQVGPNGSHGRRRKQVILVELVDDLDANKLNPPFRSLSPYLATARFAYYNICSEKHNDDNIHPILSVYPGGESLFFPPSKMSARSSYKLSSPLSVRSALFRHTNVPKRPSKNQPRTPKNVFRIMSPCHQKKKKKKNWTWSKMFVFCSVADWPLSKKGVRHHFPHHRTRRAHPLQSVVIYGGLLVGTENRVKCQRMVLGCRGHTENEK